MESKYVFEKRENYLYVIIIGKYIEKDFLSYPKIIHDRCAKENVYKVLINALDVKETELTPGQRFFLGEKVVEVLGHKIKLATVWPAQNITKLAETVMINRGGNVRVFPDIKIAEEWLLL